MATDQSDYTRLANIMLAFWALQFCFTEALC